MNTPMAHLLHNLFRSTWLLHRLERDVILEANPGRLVWPGSLCEGSGPAARIACLKETVRDEQAQPQCDVRLGRRRHLHGSRIL